MNGCEVRHSHCGSGLMFTDILITSPRVSSGGNFWLVG
jgi:hypothetical protein